MTKPGDSQTKKTIGELAKEFPEKTYRELEKYRDTDRVEEAIGIGHNHPPKGVCVTGALRKDLMGYKEYEKDVIDFNPDYLFHLGAITDLEVCENDSENAYQTNTISVENATYIANKLNIPMLYISTAGIFDGKQDIYDDWDQPNPLGVYARTKYLGEKFVQSNKNNYLICRPGWMMGGGPKKDKKFIKKITTQIKDNVKILNIVDDKFGTPTYTIDFAKNVKSILEKEYWGLYNMVCDGLTSRFDVTEELLKILNLNNEIKINKVNSAFFSNKYFAPRPHSERLINSKLKLRSLNIMKNWKIALKEYVDEYYIEYLNIKK